MQNIPLRRNATVLTEREQKECAERAAKTHPAHPNDGVKEGVAKTPKEQAKPKAS